MRTKDKRRVLPFYLAVQELTTRQEDENTADDEQRPESTYFVAPRKR